MTYDRKQRLKSVQRTSNSLNTLESALATLAVVFMPIGYSSEIAAAGGEETGS